MKKRARQLGLHLNGAPGEQNAIIDVPGVLVGSTTLIQSPTDGKPQVRTGVTAILPRGHQSEPCPVLAGLYALNGNGEMTGSHWIRDAGVFLGPICITNTHSVGIVHHATVKWMTSHYQSFQSDHLWAMPVIAETYDGVLNDINGQHVTEQHVIDAILSANSGPVAEGNSGGGTGMICYEFKGGTGTSSRLVDIEKKSFVIGALVQANHGLRDWLTVLGEPVGKTMRNDLLFERESGSIIVIIATNLPMRPDQLQRLARRAAIGIGRSGTPGGNNSGDIFLAFSTANSQTVPGHGQAFEEMTHINDDLLDLVYLAAVEAIDEAILNAMLAAEDTPTFKPPDKICRAIDADDLTRKLRAAEKCD